MSYNHLIRNIVREELEKMVNDDVIFKDREVGGIIDNEDCDSKDNHASSYMAKPQLFKIAKYASGIYDMIDDDKELTDWMESHIAQISNMISSVYHKLDHDRFKKTT